MQKVKKLKRKLESSELDGMVVRRINEDLYDRIYGLNDVIDKKDSRLFWCYLIIFFLLSIVATLICAVSCKL